ncbi:PH domain-containing protein [Aerococcaceae bacterium zg-ZUI334]|nr:PH domain-containing protein [Aerococcaceae bacterium zg-ZUI334]
MVELSKFSEWTFYEEVTSTQEINSMLREDEHVFKAYKTIRDVAVFTNLRLIVVDSQGFTGKKKEIYSVPYKSIHMWSTENSGTFDFNSEVQLWTKAGVIKINLGKKVNVRDFDKLIQNVCL